MANNNLTSNAIEETKTLSNKLAISGYFDLFFSNETCSYYYTNSEVHEGNNFKFDPLTSVGNPILLAQFADDNYDCKINSLADQNTDIISTIFRNVFFCNNTTHTMCNKNYLIIITNKIMKIISRYLRSHSPIIREK